MEAGTTVAPYRTDAGSGRPTRSVTRGVIDAATETKQAFKTTEFWAMVGVIVAILVSAAAIKGGDTSGTDEFVARRLGSTSRSSPAPT